jgi:hypothetical protein
MMPQLCDLLLEFPLIGKKFGINDDLALDVLIEDFDVVARLQPLGPRGRHRFEEWVTALREFHGQ